ncbi:ABC transporter permease [Leucobacter soli]|uniref:ABC transmembrane type-1 domain-containing protein n=1 Tax=Leucobacter soli TaxID=2812850 RepID=A0A916JVJ4_9MICO|nr:ABC transporter permease [Leucobacter soli]CAG7606312.1 hypothetical protein LEUCIP111803_00912 [Leucobacter soli]
MTTDLHAVVSRAPRRDRRGSIWANAAWLYVPALLILLPVFLAPTILLLSMSVTAEPAGLSHYQELFGSNLFWTVLWRSVVMSFVVAAIALVIGLPYASIANSAGPRMSAVLYGAIVSSLFFSVIVRAYAWLALLGTGGPVIKFFEQIGIPTEKLALVNSPTGVVIGMVQYGVPFMVLAISDVMRRVDSSYDRAAATLGAGPITRWVKVKLPMLMPGITAGITIVFVTTLGYFIIPSILGSPQQMMIGQLISQQVGTTMNWGMGAAMASVLLIITLAIVLVMQWVGKRIGRQQ